MCRFGVCASGWRAEIALRWGAAKAAGLRQGRNQVAQAMSGLCTPGMPHGGNRCRSGAPRALLAGRNLTKHVQQCGELGRQRLEHERVALGSCRAQQRGRRRRLLLGQASRLGGALLLAGQRRRPGSSGGRGRRRGKRHACSTEVGCTTAACSRGAERQKTSGRNRGGWVGGGWAGSRKAHMTRIAAFRQLSHLIWAPEHRLAWLQGQGAAWQRGCSREGFHTTGGSVIRKRSCCALHQLPLLPAPPQRPPACEWPPCGSRSNS